MTTAAYENDINAKVHISSTIDDMPLVLLASRWQRESDCDRQRECAWDLDFRWKLIIIRYKQPVNEQFNNRGANFHELLTLGQKASEIMSQRRRGLIISL